MKTYLFFENAPRSTVYEIKAENKRNALKKICGKFHKTYKFTADSIKGRFWLVEKSAFCNYMFKATSYLFEV